MDLATVMSVAQTLFSTLQCQDLRDMRSVFSYKSQLDNLRSTVKIIQAVIRDADSREELSDEARLYIELLKDAVYDADDLLDEFLTVIERKKKKLRQGGLSKKVTQLYSRIKELAIFGPDMSQRAKEIGKRLDRIAKKHNDFGFRFDHQPIRKRLSRETSSRCEPNIVGRDDDKKKIVDMMLDPDVKMDLSCLTIVVMGGLGKTTLAQLVYSDPMIVQAFPSRFWVCVGDEDKDKLDVKSILVKILKLADEKDPGNLDLELLQIEVRKHLVKRKFLLILDDMWNENPTEWSKLVTYFTECIKGSWMVVTTRSTETARIVRNGRTHILEGLSEDDSWRLFEKMAFEEEQAQKQPHLVKIGKDIVQKCANVPLTIRVVGGLLYGQDQKMWESFQKKELGQLIQVKNDISPILKLSYHHLDYSLKSCFNYCALFPRDYVINKEELIGLWIAQGFVKSSDESKSIDDVAEEYFLILSQRCFFQEIKEDDFGEIVSCKIHDLMHNIAQEMAGEEICVADFSTSNLDKKKIRHFSFYKRMGPCSFDMTETRTLLQLSWWPLLEEVDTPPLGNCVCLRAMKLKLSETKSLFGVIHKLLHLRYLDLSGSHLETLPNSITKLSNLQILKLNSCFELKELPTDLSKLVKLRVLDITNCHKLIDMPLGLDELGFLHTLPLFIVNGENSSLKQPIIEKLRMLRALRSLKGNLKMRLNLSRSAAYVKENRSEGGYLRRMQNLKQVFIWFIRDKNSDGTEEYEEALVEDLQPHDNLRTLELGGYHGLRMPSWARDKRLAISLPNLVRICLADCDRLKYLDLLGELLFLEELSLENLRNLEYIENTGDSYATIAGKESFFCALKVLYLFELPKLKGWWRGMGDDVNQLLVDSLGGIGSSSGCSSSSSGCSAQSFPPLIQLRINGCPMLTSFPLCSGVQELSLYCFNERLQIIFMATGRDEKRGGRYLKTDNMVACLRGLLPMEALKDFDEMFIRGDERVGSLSEVGEALQCCSSTLRILRFWDCPQLTSLCGVVEHLTALEQLHIRNVPRMTLSSNDGIPWTSLSQSLRCLTLVDLPQLLNLPEGMQHLTNLQTLAIVNCNKLESVPELMKKLTSLESFQIRAYSDILRERCGETTGQDWPNIQHIPRRLMNIKGAIPGIA